MTSIGIHHVASRPEKDREAEEKRLDFLEERRKALRFTSEPEQLTTGVLYDIQRATLIDEMLEIREKAIGQAPPPRREEILRVFAPAM